MEAEDAARQILRDGRNARVLDLPPELGASDTLERASSEVSGASSPPETSTTRRLPLRRVLQRRAAA